jgi:predicted DNA binding CopG/RHH family protein
MAMAITIDEMVSETVDALKQVCADEGVDYQEFICALDKALRMKEMDVGRG